MSYVRIDRIKLENSGFLGTAVKIVAQFNLSTPTTVRISIIGPYNDTKVTNASMTRDAAGFYSYVYQSVEGGDAGTYTASIEAVDGTYTTLKEVSFDLATSVLEDAL